MNRKANNNLITALYCRLSIEDGGDSESMSISNQKSMLSDYAAKNGLLNCSFYVDDGYTGRNFNRPDFKRMVADIEAGKIGCVITKDLSRLGRNYIEAGSYIEVFFPRHHVRYIAITDGVDTLTKQEMDITPFKNILNDMFSRDISKKVAAGCMARSRQGKFVGGPTPFGLMRDPENKGHLITNPTEAPTIKLIYDFALTGMGSFNIARKLMDENIPTGRGKKVGQYYDWSFSRVLQILKNPFYKGAHVVCKTHQKGIRSGTYDMIPRDQWEIIEESHEPIVSKDEWEQVQKLIDARPKVSNGIRVNPYDNIFSGLIHCADCGTSLSTRHEKAGRSDIDRTTKKPREAIDKSYYVCRTYIKLGKKCCTSHKIEARDLYNIVLGDIQYHAQQAIENPDDYYKKLCNKLERTYDMDDIVLQKEMLVLNNRINEIETMFFNLYQDKAKGIINEQRFMMMTAKFDEEQAEIKNRLQVIVESLSHSTSRNKQVSQFMNEISRYATIDKLDDAMVHKLIENIIVEEVQEVDGERVQTIKIIYNFIGELDGEARSERADGNYKKKTLQLSASA